jgi:hypothetical protein
MQLTINYQAAANTTEKKASGDCNTTSKGHNKAYAKSWQPPA